VKFAFIAEKAALGVVRLCRALGVSKAGFDAWRKRAPSARAQADEVLKVHVRAAHASGPKGRRTYGSPRVHRALGRPP
jgi:putative transposase